MTVHYEETAAARYRAARDLALGEMKEAAAEIRANPDLDAHQRLCAWADVTDAYELDIVVPLYQHPFRITLADGTVHNMIGPYNAFPGWERGENLSIVGYLLDLWDQEDVPHWEEIREAAVDMILGAPMTHLHMDW